MIVEFGWLGNVLLGKDGRYLFPVDTFSCFAGGTVVRGLVLLALINRVSSIREKLSGRGDWI